MLAPVGLMSSIQLPTKIALMKGGIGAGLMGGFALFSSFFAIDQMLDIPAGTFYKTIGVTTVSYTHLTLPTIYSV